METQFNNFLALGFEGNQEQKIISWLAQEQNRQKDIFRLFFSPMIFLLLTQSPLPIFKIDEYRKKYPMKLSLLPDLSRGFIPVKVQVKTDFLLFLRALIDKERRKNPQEKATVSWNEDFLSSAMAENPLTEGSDQTSQFGNSQPEFSKAADELIPLLVPGIPLYPDPLQLISTPNGNDREKKQIEPQTLDFTKVYLVGGKLVTGNPDEGFSIRWGIQYHRPFPRFHYSQ